MSERPSRAGDRYFAAAQEDRCAPRARVAIPAVLRLTGAPGFKTIVHDLSLSGFCSAVVGPVSPGSLCWLTLPRHAAMPAQVVWWNNGLAGCAFQHLLAPGVYDGLLAPWRSGGGFWPAR